MTGEVRSPSHSIGCVAARRIEIYRLYHAAVRSPSQAMLNAGLFRHINTGRAREDSVLPQLRRVRSLAEQIHYLFSSMPHATLSMSQISQLSENA
jgi:hypothetical protein